MDDILLKPHSPNIKLHSSLTGRKPEERVTAGASHRTRISTLGREGRFTLAVHQKETFDLSYLSPMITMMSRLVRFSRTRSSVKGRAEMRQNSRGAE